MADNGNNRITRELENRESAQRPKAWQPPQTLPTPEPKEGWAFRWIRASMMGQADPTNVSAKFREGWEPVKASDHPELQYMPDATNRHKDNVEIGGLILCKARQEMVDQRNAYYAQQAINQSAAVDNNFMRERDRRSNMDLFAERKTDVSFGSGKAK